MQRHIAAVMAVGAALGFAACATDAVTPTGVQGPGARALALNSTLGCVGKQEQITVNPSVDDRTAIENASAGYKLVLLTGSNYTVNGTIKLSSCTEVAGNGQNATTITQQKLAENDSLDFRNGSSVFNIVETNGTATENVMVRDLRVVGTFAVGARPWDGSKARAAVYVRGGRDITVSRITTQNLGIAMAELYGNITAARLNSRVRVHQSIATGWAGNWPAIGLYWVDSATVANNRITNFRFGIVAAGGDADPSHNAPRGYQTVGRTGTMLTQRVRIEGNFITDPGFKIRQANGSFDRTVNVGAGIQTSMVQYARIAGNDVEYCADICIDVEGSRDVEVTGNGARYALGAPLGFYFDNVNVKFTWNTVRNKAEFDHLLFRNLGSHHSYGGRYSDGIEVHNNTFIFDSTGVGEVVKYHSSTFSFVNNIVDGGVVNFTAESTYNGSVVASGNEIKLGSRATSKPALSVGYSANNNVSVTGNLVTSDIAQSSSVPGIAVRQSWLATTESRIQGNRVKRFPASVRYSSSGACHTFFVHDNIVTGTVVNETPGAICAQSTSSNNTQNADPNSF